MRILNSGSDGNCCIVRDKDNNTILLDCGLPYNDIISNIDVNKLDFVCTTHHHFDHRRSLQKFKDIYIDTYTWENVKDGRLIDTPHWKILPMQLVHNVECFGFLIYSKIEKKKIVYITDTNYIPTHLDWSNTDLIIMDTNYSEEIVKTYQEQGKDFNPGCFNHLPVEKVAELLKSLDKKPSRFVAYHLSNSNLCSVDIVTSTLSPLVENLYIAKPNTEIEF